MVTRKATGTWRLLLALAGGMAAMLPASALPLGRPTAVPGDPAEPPRHFGGLSAMVPLEPGGPVDMRPFPPKAGRNRCINVNGIAGAQLFGDRAIEVSMRDGKRFRLFFARECQALSFYQGFYYKRLQGGSLCAGRDVIGARSGGECPIASIIPVRRFRR